jgi:hypothetical protein
LDVSSVFTTSPKPRPGTDVAVPQRFLIPQRVAFLPDSQLRLEFGDALLQWTDQFLNLLG